jgi:Uma2 family endonuclease
MKAMTQPVPESLIYEMVNGVPIYYKGYKEYLKGNKQIDELMGSSYLQGALATQLIILLSGLLDLTKYRLISNEIGLKFNKKSWRAADLVIYDINTLREIPLTNKYLEVAPEIVIEIDTKAELDEVKNPLGYYQEKTDQLLAFGVKKVIWIFTETEKVMIAKKGEDWQITNWKNDIEIMENAKVNVLNIINGLKL